jgi:redox-sensitive bicupin YhaK (pirin superfamily)
MKKTLHRAHTRGVAEHGWLSSRHTFSFAEYQNPERIRFGLLRVINDDVVRPARGFGMHPHENMEIVTIPLAGELRHEDSMGNTQHIRAGEVQIMSAGTGLTHSEFNDSDSTDVELLQIWVFPKERDIEPRYDQKSFAAEDRANHLQEIVSPEKPGSGVWINQDAWFVRGDFRAGQAGHYVIQKPGNGVYLFVIDGSVEVAGESLDRRDGLGVEDFTEIEFAANADAQLLFIEVPMQ